MFIWVTWLVYIVRWYYQIYLMLIKAKDNQKILSDKKKINWLIV